MIYIYNDGLKHYNCICDGIVKNRPTQKIRKDKNGNNIEYSYFEVLYDYDEASRQYMQIQCYVFNPPSVRVTKYVYKRTRVMLFGKIQIDRIYSRRKGEKRYVLIVSTIFPLNEMYSLIERIHDNDTYEAKLLHEYNKQTKKRRPQDLDLMGEAEKILTQEDVLL